MNGIDALLVMMAIFIAIGVFMVVTGFMQVNSEEKYESV